MTALLHCVTLVLILEDSAVFVLRARAVMHAWQNNCRVKARYEKILR